MKTTNAIITKPNQPTSDEKKKYVLSLHHFLVNNKLSKVSLICCSYFLE